MSDLNTSMMISASGMRAQSQRMQVIAENIANANSTGETAGSDPYQRQVPIFGQMVDEESGGRMVEMTRVARDESEFGMRYDPNHPAADGNGYVKTPNVNSLIEMMDMREAQRTYEANLNLLDAARTMNSRTLELMR